MREMLQLQLCLVGILLLFSGAEVRAQIGGAALDQILPAISTPSLANLRAAEQAWQKQDPAAADVLTRYAMTLALVANNRHEPAFEMVQGIPDTARKTGPLRRLWVWSTLKVRKDELAYNEIKSLIGELKIRSANLPTDKDLDDVQFVSKIVVYLEHIAEREEPLAPSQATIWRQALEGLPPAWNADLANIQTELVAAHGKRKQELEDTFKPWKLKTDQEFAAAQQKVVPLAQQEAAAAGLLTAAIAAQKAFAATAGPQLKVMEASAKKLTGQRNAIPRPREPSRPSRPRPGKDGKIDPGDQRDYDRELREYNDDMREYDRDKRDYDQKVGKIDGQLASLNASAQGLYQQEAAHQQDILAKKADVTKAQTPLRIAERNELRLKLLLADRPNWDSPGSLATLRSLDAYLEINLARELARIQTARFK